LLERGSGFWIRIPAKAPSNSYPVYLYGEVPSATTTPLRIYSGNNLLGYPYPVAMAWTSTLMAKSGRPLDILLTYGPTGYTANVCRAVDANGTVQWSKTNQMIGVAQGFWYVRKKISTVIDEPKPYVWP
jgi:hypothetical protein